MPLTDRKFRFERISHIYITFCTSHGSTQCYWTIWTASDIHVMISGRNSDYFLQKRRSESKELHPIIH